MTQKKNPIIANIPNTVTCLNLISGCVAVYMAFNIGRTIGGVDAAVWAMIAIAAAAVFDFLDGATARLLKAYSNLGKDLDSLSDLVSFGVAPAMLMLNVMLQYSATPGYALRPSSYLCAERSAWQNSTTTQNRPHRSKASRYRRMPFSGLECMAG